MSSSIIVKPGETMADIAVQYLGSLAAWPDIAALNGLAATATLSAGQVLNLPEIQYSTNVAQLPTQAESDNTVIVQPGQTLADIAVQWCGSPEAWPEIARLNNKGLTSTLIAGSAVVVPAVIEKRTARYFLRGGYKPATGDFAEPEGIGYWYIELDFKVS